MFSFPLPLEFDFLEPPTQERQAIQYGKKFALAVHEEKKNKNKK